MCWTQAVTADRVKKQCKVGGSNDSNLNNYGFYLSWRSQGALLIVSEQGESPVVCVCVCVSKWYMHRCVCLRVWNEAGGLLPIVFLTSSLVCGEMGAFSACSSCSDSQSVSQPVHQVRISVVESVSAGEHRPGSVRLFRTWKLFTP